MDTILPILDLFGTFAFAISGGFKAVKYELDLLGLLVLSTITGIGGGIVRDVISGQFPPAALQNEIYFIICIAGGLLVYFTGPKIARRWDLILVADAIGLGVFAGIGAIKGVNLGYGMVGIVLLGVLTATGGGVIRDLLVNEIPIVIRTDFYATAVIIGCAVLGVLHRMDAGRTVMLVSCILVTIASRMVAMRLDLSLPRVRSLPESPSRITRSFLDRKKRRDREGL